MHQTKIDFKKVWLLVPVAGCVIFTILYLVAATLYPGGSQANAQAAGFSWVHNYWCNLLSVKALNGSTNPSKPIAHAAMVVLMVTAIWFFVVTAYTLAVSRIIRNAIVGCGALSMMVLPALATPYHDAVINVSGFFGVVALAIIYTALYYSRWFGLFYFGLLQFGLIALNNYLYYAGGRLYYLPLVQKLTFASFLLWVCLTNIRLVQNKADNSA